MSESQYLERLRFFNGRLLTAADFQLEQQYHRDKLKRHNRSLHGFGIVSGLKVTVHSGQITVEPGLALDCEGNELVIAAAQIVGAPSTTDDWHTAYVNLRYVEQEIDCIPAYAAAEPCTVEAAPMEASTIREGFELAVAPENFNRAHRHLRARWLACGQRHALTIAKLRRAQKGWRVDRGYRPPAIK
jgi:hypothetical protein